MFASVAELDTSEWDLLQSINDDNLFYAVVTQKVNTQTWDATQIKQHWKRCPHQHAWMVGICVLHLLCNPRKSHFNPLKIQLARSNQINITFPIFSMPNGVKFQLKCIEQICWNLLPVVEMFCQMKITLNIYHFKWRKTNAFEARIPTSNVLHQVFNSYFQYYAMKGC